MQACDEDPALHLEFLANYIAELSLLEYSLLSYSPSLIAASAIFLARFVLQPTKYPWNSTLAHYTQYKRSELSECVKTLHRLSSVGPGSNLPSITEKYSQHKKEAPRHSTKGAATVAARKGDEPESGKDWSEMWRRSTSPKVKYSSATTVHRNSIDR
uniref:Cyclin C-terminal domain-containing protein n=1 Tax=Zea mays TaxID=4577 RepID=A0A804QAR1_MAIZE